MALATFLKRLFARKTIDSGKSVDELAARLGMPADALRTLRASYREFRIPKRTGGPRVIHAPDKDLKSVQRRILRRLLAKLHSHAAATGFERKSSIVHNARCHAGSAVVLRLAVKAFTPGPVPFTLLHVDTGHNYPEVLAFRDEAAAAAGTTLVVRQVEDSIAAGSRGPEMF